MTLTSDQKKALVSTDEQLSVREQSRLLGLNRSTFYYEAVKDSDSKHKEIKRIMREFFLEQPFAGVRKIVKELQAHDHMVGRKLVSRLRKEMHLKPVGVKPRDLSAPRKDHKKYPYLLKNIEIKKPNQVWASDITYIPTPYGHLYLAAIIDWHSRKVLSWRLSNTMTVDICTDPLNEALEKYGSPEIFNTDQGSQYTSEIFTDILKERKIEISMNGKGRCLDNVIVERFWRSIKYEMIFTHEFVSVRELRGRIAKYMDLFNSRRRHQALDYMTPDSVYAMAG